MDRVEVEVKGLTKICTGCKKELPATAEYFHQDKTRKDGLQTKCRECTSKYNKKYKKENKDYFKQHWKQWYKKNGDNRKKYRKKYYEENKDYYIEYSKQYREENKERVTKYNRIYCKENKDYYKEYYEENKERIREYWKQHRKENKDEYRIRDQKRRAKTRELPHTLKMDEWQQTLEYFDSECAYCGMSQEEHIEECNQVLHQDHFIPLIEGGGYTKDNIVPACRSCNCSKGGSDFFDWYLDSEVYDDERYIRMLAWLDVVTEDGEIVEGVEIEHRPPSIEFKEV